MGESSQCVCVYVYIYNHNVHFKYLTILFVSYTSIKNWNLQNSSRRLCKTHKQAVFKSKDVKYQLTYKDSQCTNERNENPVFLENIS